MSVFIYIGPLANEYKRMANCPKTDRSIWKFLVILEQIKDRTFFYLSSTHGLILDGRK